MVMYVRMIGRASGIGCQQGGMVHMRTHPDPHLVSRRLLFLSRTDTNEFSLVNRLTRSMLATNTHARARARDSRSPFRFLFCPDPKGYLPIQRAAANGLTAALRELLSSSSSTTSKRRKRGIGKIDLDATVPQSGKTVRVPPLV